MNRNFLKLLVLPVLLLAILLQACKNNNINEAKTENKPKPDTTKHDNMHPFFSMSGFTIALGFATFGDPKDCTGKGICSASLTEPVTPPIPSHAPVIMFYKQSATVGQSTLICLVNQSDITPPITPPGTFPPTSIAPTSSNPLIIDKSVFNTQDDITIPGSTTIRFVAPNTPPLNLPVGELSMNF